MYKWKRVRELMCSIYICVCHLQVPPVNVNFMEPFSISGWKFKPHFQFEYLNCSSRLL